MLIYHHLEGLRIFTSPRSIEMSKSYAKKVMQICQQTQHVLPNGSS